MQQNVKVSYNLTVDNENFRNGINRLWLPKAQVCKLYTLGNGRRDVDGPCWI
jgi:hypothetical protein